MKWRDELQYSWVRFNDRYYMYIFYAKFVIRAIYKLKTGEIRLTSSWVREVSKANHVFWEDWL
jgi:hypothetical protein